MMKARHYSDGRDAAGGSSDVPKGHHMNSRGLGPTEERNGCSTPQGSHSPQNLDRGLTPTAIHIWPLCGLKSRAASTFSPSGPASNLKLKTSNSPEGGVALVITLILLSIITFMAITFLVISRHASEAVTTVTQQAIAQQAAQAALKNAEANIIAAMTAKGEGFSFGPVISQNYESPAFTNSAPASVANVNYFTSVDINGNPIPYAGANYAQMLNNLMVLPRPPVFVTTNSSFAPDFRYYLDLNRNGIYDPATTNINANGTIGASVPFSIGDQFGVPQPSVAGDPEWIGILEHPDQPHSRSNLFVARYAFFAQPIGNSLDINFIHNQTKQLGASVDGFLRNQGVGSWEINLAGFLHGLNPFVWSYGNGLAGINYVGLDTNTPNSQPLNNYFSSLGTAFQDAAEVLQIRYNPFVDNLPSLPAEYPNFGFFAPVASNIDYYARGPLMDGESVPAPVNQFFNQGWSGNGNVNQYFTTQDPLTLVPSFVAPAGNFTGRLANATAGITPGFQAPDANFNRYTYYRMLSQMGMDSAPEPVTKLNLNYINIGGYAATNFVPWTDRLIEYPLGSGRSNYAAVIFFTNAANLLLATQPNFIVPYPLTSARGVPPSMTNLSTSYIPIFPTNYYTPSVHRMLQLAANIYDAANPKTTNISSFDYPSVFRPIFGFAFGVNTLGQKTTNIWIRGYQEVTPNDNPQAYNLPYYSLTNFQAILGGVLPRFGVTNGVFQSIAGMNMNIYGIPWIVGAKKGLPNFNQVSLESFTGLTRKLQITKPNQGADRSSWHTNVQYVLSASNLLSATAWNSYALTYPRGVYITGFDNLITTFTNEHGIVTSISGSISNLIATSLTPFVTPVAQFPTTPLFEPSNSWAGVGANLTLNLAASFRFPLMGTNILLPGSIYGSNTVYGFSPTGSFSNVPNALTAFFIPTTGYPLPRFGINLTNQFSMTMVDTNTGRVIDHVQLEGMGGQRDLTGASELQGGDDWGPGGVWDTNRLQFGSANQNISMYGIENQIDASLQPPPYTSPGYATPVHQSDWNLAVVQTMGFSSVSAATTAFAAFFNGNTNVATPLSMQVPFTPTRSVCVYYTWGANDPLVHYTLPDLTDLVDSSNGIQTNWVFTNIIQGKLGQLNQRYNPWGGTSSLNGGNGDYNFNVALMDPMQTSSDAWQFPNTNLPGIGWLGRVHRGTPWQTVYMKSQPVDPGQWQKWTGNIGLFPGTNLVPDSLMSSPINDWAIFDLFTTAPNENATRGQLSVNQTNFAAWAAVLDGVIVLSNVPTGYQPVLIDPNSANGVVSTIFQSIQNARLNTNRYGGLMGIATPNGVFTRLGDILAAPALSVTSPFLDIGDASNPTQPNDIAYEWLPQQIMSLLRVGQPRYVIYAYGQSLKPAQNSIVSGGQYYGTCTNYQITGETETRYVVRFDPVTPPSPTNVYSSMNPTQNPLMPAGMFPQPSPLPPIPPPRPQVRGVIEGYSVLPPE
jgi:hypothetical protein